MPKITYISARGTERTVDVPVGTSVMRGAVFNDVEGIVAQCGGNAQCATCHVYVDDTAVGTLDPAGPARTGCSTTPSAPAAPPAASAAS